MLVACAVVLAVGAAAAPPASACAGLPHARVVAASPTSVVYRVANGQGTFGCLLGGGRRRWLGDARGRPRVLGSVTTRGQLVAYGLTVYGSENELEAKYELRLLDLRTGRLVVRAPAASAQGLDPSAADGVRRVVLTPRGAVAWVGADTSAAPTRFEVWVADAAGRRRLAAGTEVVSNSLAVAGGAVTWLEGGVPGRAVPGGRPRRGSPG